MSKKKQTDGMNPNGLNEEPMVPAQVSPQSQSRVPSKDVFTSYIFSTSSRSLSKYGERLLMEVISVAQEYTIDAALGINKLNFSEKYQEKFAIIDIPVKNLLNADDTTNYTKAKEAAVELMKIYHTVEAPVLDENGNPKTYSDGRPQYQFASFHLLDRVTVNQKPGIVSVKLGEETWSQILDMGKGYTRYNLLTAKSLDDVVAIRLFQLMSNTSKPLYFSIERIKGILGLMDKYVSNPTGFIRRVIEPAEKEIKEKCPFEVVHELSYDQTAKKGRRPIVGITFTKVKKQTIIQNPADVLDPYLMNVLIKDFGFDARGIRSNLKLFAELMENGVDIIKFLKGIEDKAKQANSPQGYAIKSLQNLLANKKPPVSSRVVAATPAEPVSDTEKQTGTVVAPAVKKRKKAGDRLDVKTADEFDNSGLEEL
ncbi:MAG: replication initiation protein [Candidatus Cryptobacteroides sp.]